MIPTDSPDRRGGLFRPCKWCLKRGPGLVTSILVDKDLSAKLADFAGRQSTARLFLLLTASHIPWAPAVLSGRSVRLQMCLLGDNNRKRP